MTCAVNAERPDPPVCATTPLTVSVRSWPSTIVGKSASIYFTASQAIVSATVLWVPRLQLAVIDGRGCHLTVLK